MTSKPETTKGKENNQYFKLGKEIDVTLNRQNICKLYYLIRNSFFNYILYYTKHCQLTKIIKHRKPSPKDYTTQ